MRIDVSDPRTYVSIRYLFHVALFLVGTRLPLLKTVAQVEVWCCRSPNHFTSGAGGYKDFLVLLRALEKGLRNNTPIHEWLWDEYVSAKDAKLRQPMCRRNEAIEAMIRREGL